jgi:hypothetical protein
VRHDGPRVGHDGRLSLPSGGNAGLSVAGHCDYFVQLPSMVEARTEPADRHGLPVRHSFNARTYLGTGSSAARIAGESTPMAHLWLLGDCYA